MLRLETKDGNGATIVARESTAFLAEELIGVHRDADLDPTGIVKAFECLLIPCF